jgi:hypothetical protein
LSSVFLKRISSLKAQHKDYEKVINCLSTHIPKIFDESLPPEEEIIFMNSKGKLIYNLPKNSSPTNGHIDETMDEILRKASSHGKN